MSLLIGERVYLGLGSNLDGPEQLAPEQHLQAALKWLQVLSGVKLVGVSSFYRTAPWGNRDQPDFINAVAALDCNLSPDALLHEVLVIEHRMGRVRDTSRWAPRIIDIDILHFGRRLISTSELSLPHPHASERAFVMVPLVEVCAPLGDPALAVWQYQLSNLPHDDVVRLHPVGSN
jgi:2-amino-4-hydroxy-6-hydroxymethyldihydropteridine diphosphokinase